MMMGECDVEHGNSFGKELNIKLGDGWFIAKIKSPQL